MPRVTATESPASISNQVQQLANGSTTGVVVNPASDAAGNPAALAFFGGTPAPQQSGPTQAAVTVGQAGGMISVINSATVSPTAVQPNTAAEYGMTLLGATASVLVAAGDVVFINKPAAQAGLGIGNVRVSASNQLGVTFSNYTAATITPTVNQSYGVVALRGLPSLSAVLSPAAVQPKTAVEQRFAVAGLAPGLVQVSKPTVQAGLDIVGCRVVATGTLGITFCNLTAATITPTASQTYTVTSLGGLDAQANTILVQQNFALTASANTVNATAQGAVMTGLAATDTVLGVSKPTAQSNFGIGGAFVSAAGTLGVTVLNFAAATVTPTATDMYSVGLYRPAPVAPLVVSTASLTPAAVAANTTAEQSLAVAGLVAGSLVWVNKPSAQAGLGVVGVRVGSTGTLAITYSNVTTQAITPAAESYVVGNFQLPLGDANSEWIQNASPAGQAQSGLVDAMRSALVSTNLIAGS